MVTSKPATHNPAKTGPLARGGDDSHVFPPLTRSAFVEGRGFVHAGMMGWRALRREAPWMQTCYADGA